MNVGATTATGQVLRFSVGLQEVPGARSKMRFAASRRGLGKAGDQRHARISHPPCGLSWPRPRGSKDATPGAWPRATRTPAWVAARPTRPRPRWRSFPTAQRPSAPPAPRWGRTWSACWPRATAQELGLPFQPRQRAGDGHRPGARRRADHRQPPDLRQRQRRAAGGPHDARTHPGRAGREVRRAARRDRLPRRAGLCGRGTAGRRARGDGERDWRWSWHHGHGNGSNGHLRNLPTRTISFADAVKAADRRRPLAQAALRILGAQDAAAGHGRRHARGLLLRRACRAGERGRGNGRDRRRARGVGARCGPRHQPAQPLGPDRRRHRDGAWAMP